VRLLYRSAWHLLAAPLKATRHATPLGSLGEDHVAAQRHPTRPGLLNQLRSRRHPVDDGDDLIRVAPGTRWGASMSPPPDKVTASSGTLDPVGANRTGVPAYERIFAAPRSQLYRSDLGCHVSRRRRVPDLTLSLPRQGWAAHRPCRSSLVGENAPRTINAGVLRGSGPLLLPIALLPFLGHAWNL
jgi:hypothetical protein